MALIQKAAHLVNKFTRGIRTAFERIRNFADGVIEDAEFVFIDQRIVNAVDGKIAQCVIVEIL